ncbi:aminotransferase class IV [Actibacterium mucosum KCTC 23349]|uniref:Probable branched-chain-amino-acid aminotransferase n=1 Tax=Actibacterium mucosum KCTC 23349 TaxID=1454373 RepID=A0A037ZFQ9_9RHOB|nr:aminotransferase class IV [Actibacterium mucosum]KAJ54366.1 aminotransferase class IV [Actibacterium mucosum KCTC 23349]
MTTENAPTTHDAEDDPRNADLKIWVNGALVHKDEAVVSVYDSGFMLGDGMWEGMRLYDGEWAFFDDHMDRLFNSLKAVSLEIDETPDDIRDLLDATAKANGMTGDAHCRLMITRGRKVKPFQHPSLSRSGPTIVAILEHSKPAEHLAEKGIRLASVPQVRGLPHSQDAKFNSHSKLNCVIACLQAEQAGADEALMLDPHGFVNTTNACNFFIVRKDEVWTSTGDYCMNGVTRQKVIDLCRDNGIPVREKNYSLYEAYSADEAFLTGTFGAQTPVASIDGKVVGSGDRPVMTRIRALYKQLIAKDIAGQKQRRTAAHQ